MSTEKSRGHERTRNWACVIYPDSAPENWREILDESQIEWIESPLHDSDINPDTAELKKAHWHILLFFGGVKSYEQVVEFLKPLNCPAPQRCHNAKASVRYMAHLDHPDKHQYRVSEIKAHGGVDLAELLRPNSSERYTLIAEMIAYCRENNITEYADLLQVAKDEHFDDWFPLLCDSASYVMTCYLKSARYKVATSYAVTPPRI